MDAHSVDLDVRRVQVLLRINNILLLKWIEFQQQNPRPTPQNPPSPQQQEFLQHVMRRTHCNLTYLAMVNDKYQNPNYASQGSQPTFPAILTSPPNIPELADLYAQLQLLFPQALLMLQKRAMHSRQQALKQQSNPSPQQNPSALHQASAPGSRMDSPAMQQHRFSQQQQQQQQSQSHLAVNQHPHQPSQSSHRLHQQHQPSHQQHQHQQHLQGQTPHPLQQFLPQEQTQSSFDPSLFGSINPQQILRQTEPSFQTAPPQQGPLFSAIDPPTPASVASQQPPAVVQQANDGFDFMKWP